MKIMCNQYIIGSLTPVSSINQVSQQSDLQYDKILGMVDPDLCRWW